MLIVVAIIAILVAVSIPLVNTSLEKARIATDAANERAAKAIAVVMYLNGEANAGDELYYDAVSGKLLDSTKKDSIKEYGKCKTNNHGDDIIKVTIKEDGEHTVSWCKNGTAHGVVIK